MTTKENSGRDLRSILRDVEDKIDKMYYALHGDKDADVKGYFSRVQNLEKSEEKRSGVYTLIAVISSGVSFAIFKLSEFFKH